MIIAETLTLGSNTGITTLPAQIHFFAGGFASGSTVTVAQNAVQAAPTETIGQSAQATLSDALLRAGYELNALDKDTAEAFDATLQDGIHER